MTGRGDQWQEMYRYYRTANVDIGLAPGTPSMLSIVAELEQDIAAARAAGVPDLAIGALIVSSALIAAGAPDALIACAGTAAVAVTRAAA